MIGKIMRRLTALLALGIMLTAAGTVRAAPIMYVHDSTGNLATVNVQTGQVNLIGNLGVVLTDIAFDPSGNLYGVSFTALYSVNKANAQTTLIGNHSITGANALVFAGDGTLYSAGTSTTNLYTINVATGVGTSLGSMGFASGGDLAFNSGNLYLASAASTLVLIDLLNLSNTTQIGAFGVPSVFGLATGDDGVLYGVAGTQIFSVNTATGAATNPVNYGGQGLGTAFGQAFFTESGAEPEPVPTPAPLALLVTGLALMRLVRRNG
jgi:hypothetical protein